MREIRRKERILDDVSAQELLESGEYGFLAMVNADGGGYGIPINYVLAGNCIYFHCAPQGHKLDNLALNNRVTFTVVGNTQVVPDKFTTGYQSAMVFGTINYNLTEEERLEALRLLVKKYSVGYETIAEKYIAGSFARTAVLRLDIESRSAKTKRLHNPSSGK